MRQIQFSRLLCAIGTLAVAMASPVSYANEPQAAQKDFQKADKAAPMPPPIVGNQRDAHGCIPSAGYSWCAKEEACVQPWVLAAEKDFPKGDKAAFDAYCQAHAR